MTKILSTSTALIALVSLFGIGVEANFCQSAAQTVGQVAFHAYEQATGDFNLFKDTDDGPGKAPDDKRGVVVGVESTANLVDCVAWCYERNSGAGDGSCKGAFWMAQNDGAAQGVCTLYSTGMRSVKTGATGTHQSVAMSGTCPEDETFSNDGVKCCEIWF